MITATDSLWDLPRPFAIDVVVRDDDIDEYGHANNAVYLRWCDEVAWAHAEAVGLGKAAHVDLRRGMAAHRTELQYLAPALAGDRVRVGNWIVACDGRLRATRRFQVVRERDGAILLRALTRYVCIDLDSGKPRRMPPAFAERYVVEPRVAEALRVEKTPFAGGG